MNLLSPLKLIYTKAPRLFDIAVRVSCVFGGILAFRFISTRYDVADDLIWQIVILAVIAVPFVAVETALQRLKGPDELSQLLDQIRDEVRSESGRDDADRSAPKSPS